MLVLIPHHSTQLIPFPFEKFSKVQNLLYNTNDVDKREDIAQRVKKLDDMKFSFYSYCCPKNSKCGFSVSKLAGSKRGINHN